MLRRPIGRTLIRSQGMIMHDGKATHESIQKHAAIIRPVYELKPEDYRDVALAVLEHAEHGSPKVVLFGYTNLSLMLVNTFVNDGVIAAIADDDPAKAGWRYRGVPVEPLDQALGRSPTAVAITDETRNVDLPMLLARDPRSTDAQIIQHPNPNRAQQYRYDPLRHDGFYREVLARKDLPPSMLREQKLVFLLEHLRQTLDVEGDVMELGVFRGGSAWFIGRMLEKYAPSKKFYCYDLFEHMPVGEPEAIMCYDEIKSLMGFSPNNSVIQGDFSDYLDEVRTRRHSFIHFDLGFNQGWIDACWSSLVVGGTLLFDNFGLMAARNPIKFGLWCAERGIRVSYAPHKEQAWAIKRG